MKFLLAASFSALLAPARAVAAAPANFLLVSGVTAVDENCLVASGTGVWLESCGAAVASAQGKEIWSLATDGGLVHVSSKKCLSAFLSWRRAMQLGWPSGNSRQTAR